MKKPSFVQNQLYHIYNRGVEKRKIFLADEDYLRFIHDLFEFNDKDTIFNFSRFFKNQINLIKVQPRSLERRPRKLLVEILIFTLMPNHFHLLVKQNVENGIVKFMQKLSTGYSMYFNKKYERVGGLFQGRFKARHINEEAHFLHMPYYIHTNPIDLIERGSTSLNEAQQMEFLENYRWSSFPDYVGQKNFPSVTSREWLLNFFGGTEEYRKITREWIKEQDKNIELIKDVAIDN